MKIFVINVRNANDRRAAATRQLEQHGAEFSFFEAVENVLSPQECFQTFNERLYRLNTRRDPLPGEIGCYASHLALWKICAASNEPIVVMEDDFNLEPRFSEAIRELEGLINTFGFIRLQSFSRRRQLCKKLRPAAHRLLSTNDFDLHYVSDVPLCMLAYAISPKAAASLVEASGDFCAPVDKFLQQTWKHRTPIYALSPAVVAGSEHGRISTIGNRTQKSRQLGLLLARLLYKVQGEFRRFGFDRTQLEQAISATARRSTPPTEPEVEAARCEATHAMGRAHAIEPRSDFPARQLRP